MKPATGKLPLFAERPTCGAPTCKFGGEATALFLTTGFLLWPERARDLITGAFVQTLVDGASTGKNIAEGVGLGADFPDGRGWFVCNGTRAFLIRWGFFDDTASVVGSVTILFK